MKVLGIVTEYNPFHQGHAYHLAASKEKISADFVVCVMSGNFLQRGEPALFNKWIRAEAAVKSGIDMVLEIPTVYACSSAEYFAREAIAMLNRLGCVTHLSFGSESGYIEDLHSLSEPSLLQSENYKALLRSYMDRGFTFPRANQLALENHYPDLNFSLVAHPNNILGIEYMKALKSEKSSITPITIKRHLADYHDASLNNSICSASAIRRHLESGKSMASIRNFLPEPSYETFNLWMESGVHPVFFSNFFNLIQYRLLTSTPEDLKKIYSINEGIEYRLVEMAKKSNTLEELIQNVKTKRYLRTSIQRMLTHLLLQITKEDMETFHQESYHFGRILGASSQGLSLLNHIKRKKLSSMPLITNINKEKDHPEGLNKILQYDIMASDVYNFVSTPDKKMDFSDYIKVPYLQK